MLSWRLSNTLDASFRVEAQQDALSRFGRPGIFNSDQGSQTIVMITHDMALARFASRVVQIRDGQIVEDQRTTEAA